MMDSTRCRRAAMALAVPSALSIHAARAVEIDQTASYKLVLEIREDQ